MTLPDLIQKGRSTAERGRALAELVPYGFVALVSRFAIASVFWRSGRPVPRGVQGTAASSGPCRLHVDRRRARLSGAAGRRSRFASFGDRSVVHDHGDPTLRLSERLARPHPVDRHLVDDCFSRTWHHLARSRAVDTSFRRSGVCPLRPVVRRPGPLPSRRRAWRSLAGSFDLACENGASSSSSTSAE